MSLFEKLGLAAAAAGLITLITVVLLYIAVVLRRRVARFDVSGKVCVVTGAGSGIGRQLALDLHTRGAHVVLIDIREDLLQAVSALLASSKKPGQLVLSRVLDVTDATAVQATCASIAKQVAPLHVSVLINNAGACAFWCA